MHIGKPLSLHLSTYYFFLYIFVLTIFSIYNTIPNDLKIFKHVANLPWRMNPKNHYHFGHFFIQMWPCEVQLLVFCRAKIRIFVTSNINTLQSAWWKFLKFFPHLLNLVYYKILWLYMSNKDIFEKFGTCPRNGSFGW